MTWAEVSALVDEQAEDRELWMPSDFGAVTRVEANLQRALRCLHAAVKAAGADRLRADAAEVSVVLPGRRIDEFNRRVREAIAGGDPEVVDHLFDEYYGTSQPADDHAG